MIPETSEERVEGEVKRGVQVPERMAVERKRRDWEVRGSVERERERGRGVGVSEVPGVLEDEGEGEGERRDQIARMRDSTEEVEARSSG